MHKIFSATNWLFRKITGKQLVYITPNNHNELGMTAAWCELGFWYVGNVYDTADIAYGIAQNGLVEKDEVLLVDSILSKLKNEGRELVFYDIGANTGFYGILAAKKYGATVESFDPVAEHIHCLNETVKINNITTLTTHTIALGAEDTSKELSLAGSGSTLTRGFLGETQAPTRVVSIKTLDGLTLPLPHFLKIDVEGYEYEVLRGAEKTIADARPICFIEIAKTMSERNVSNDLFEKTITFFEKQGYAAYLHNEGKLTPIADATIPDGVHMYLFVPDWHQL